MWDYLQQHQDWFALIGGLSLFAFIGSLIIIPLIIIYLPEDFFVREPLRKEKGNLLGLGRHSLAA